MQNGDRRWLLRGGVAMLALTVGVVAWLEGSGNESAATGSAGSGARIVSESELSDVAALLGHPVYWAGPMPGTELELSETADGNVQLRYLEGEAEPGSRPAAFLTIGTYPLPDPTAALVNLARPPGSIVRRSPAGRRVVSSARSANSVYFASPDNRVQVEVYDPSPRRALALALSDQVRPIG
jgi:hypothetical protein